MSATHRGFAMSFALKFRLQRSFLTRLLQTTGLSLALMTASAIGGHAENVTVQGKDGANGANGVNPGDPGQQGGDGASAAADAGGVSPNKAMATGGNGGGGGADGGFQPPPSRTLALLAAAVAPRQRRPRRPSP